MKKNANFNNMLSKADLQTYQYPFSKKTKISNINEFRDLVNAIIINEDEKVLYNKYGLFIIRL